LWETDGDGLGKARIGEDEQRRMESCLQRRAGAVDIGGPEESGRRSLRRDLDCQLNGRKLFYAVVMKFERVMSREGGWERDAFLEAGRCERKQRRGRSSAQPAASCGGHRGSG
jgi:hypothetical protein